MPGSRPSSRGSTKGSRPPTPQSSRASITVPMGGLAWVSSTTGDYTLVKSVGGYSATNGQCFPDRRGMFTGGMTAVR